MESGYTQAKSIKRINGKSPANRLVVMIQTGGKEILTVEKDPEGEDCELNIDLDLLYLYHFLPIVELISELNPEKNGGRTGGSLKFGNDCYSINIPSALYDIISETAMRNESPYDKSAFETLLNETILSRLISGNSGKRILRVE